MAAQKKARSQMQASLLNVDVEQVWATFHQKSGWNNETIDLEKEEIRQRIAHYKTQIADLQDKLEVTENEFKTIDSREEKAREYLSEAAEAMGKFASEPVLLAALYEEFPSAKPRVGRKAGNVIAVSDQIKKKVLAQLNQDGKTKSQLKMDLAEADVSDVQLNAALKALEKGGTAYTSGEKRGTKYHLT